MPEKRMVSNFEVLNNSKELDRFIKRGFISICFLDYMRIYAYFKDEMRDNKNQKMVCYLATAEYFNMSESSIRRIIKFMES